MRTEVAIITACLPGAHDWLRDLAQSIRQTRRFCPDLQFTWVVVWDGPGEHADVDGALESADAQVLTLPAHGGVSAARNHALFSAAAGTADFIVPMDADDLVDPGGLAATVSELVAKGYDWAAANRTLLNGDRTPHWHGEREWTRGEVADNWTSPLAFHPNSIVVSADLARRVGGWPPLAANEDLLFMMLCNELAQGISVPHVLTRYRVWDRQVVNQESYPVQKAAAFSMIVETINRQRGPAGREIAAPVPGRAPGIVAVATPVPPRWSMETAWNYASTNGREYLAAGLITAVRLTEDYEWATSHGSQVFGKKGSWHARNAVDEWTIEADVFEQTYAHVDGDLYRKVVPVKAVQVMEPFVCETLEGDVLAPAGDWLIASTTARDAWPVRAAAFWDRYPH